MMHTAGQAVQTYVIDAGTNLFSTQHGSHPHEIAHFDHRVEDAFAEGRDRLRHVQTPPRPSPCEARVVAPRTADSSTLRRRGGDEVVENTLLRSEIKTRLLTERS